MLALITSEKTKCFLEIKRCMSSVFASARNHHFFPQVCTLKLYNLWFERRGKPAEVEESISQWIFFIFLLIVCTQNELTLEAFVYCTTCKKKKKEQYIWWISLRTLRILHFISTVVICEWIVRQILSCPVSHCLCPLKFLKRIVKLSLDCNENSAVRYRNDFFCFKNERCKVTIIVVYNLLFLNTI